MVATVRSRTASSESWWTHRGLEGEHLPDVMMIKTTGSPETHGALGDDVVEEVLIDDASVPLLFQVESKQHPDLRLIRLVVWIHLQTSAQGVNDIITLLHHPHLKTDETSHLEDTVVSILLFGEDLQRLLIITRSDDPVRNLRTIHSYHETTIEQRTCFQSVFVDFTSLEMILAVGTSHTSDKAMKSPNDDILSEPADKESIKSAACEHIKPQVVHRAALRGSDLSPWRRPWPEG